RGARCRRTRSASACALRSAARLLPRAPRSSGGTDGARATCAPSHLGVAECAARSARTLLCERGDLCHRRSATRDPKFLVIVAKRVGFLPQNHAMGLTRGSGRAKTYQDLLLSHRWGSSS